MSAITPKEQMFEDVTRLMDTDREKARWEPLIQAVFHGIPVVNWSCQNSEIEACKITLDQSYSAQYEHESDTMHYPKEITLSFDRASDRMNFPGNTPESKTGFYGTRDFWFFTATGASQFVEWQEANDKFVTFAITDVAVHSEEWRERQFDSALKEWENRPRTAQG